jgi:hypothetical protein
MTTPLTEEARRALLIHGSLATRMLNIMHVYLNAQKKVFTDLSQEEQETALDSLTEQIDQEISQAVPRIVAGGLKRVSGVLKSITAKDTTRAAIDVVSADPQTLHNLIDAVGGVCVIVLAGVEEHKVALEAFSTQPDQPELGLPDPYTGPPCDETHAGPPCEDPNCWQRPDTTVGSEPVAANPPATDDEEDDDD